MGGTMNSSLDTPAPGSLPKRVTAIVAGILLSLMLLVAISGDFSQTSSTSPPSLTDLATSPPSLTDLATSPPSLYLDDVSPPTEADDWNCTNVLDWNFFGAQVTENNLGGKGPNPADKKEIRYAGVFTGVDMVVTVENPDYQPNGQKGALNNGLLGKFGQVNIMSNTDAKLKFQLVTSGTETPISVSEDQTILFSVYDLDSGNDQGVINGHEYVQFTSGVASYSVTSPTTVAITGDVKEGTLYAENTRMGDASDNPTDPLRMTDLQKQSEISVTLKGTSSWEFTFGSKDVHPPSWMKKKNFHTTGRNILFAGRSQGDCACVGVSDWKLEGNLQYNNLGGKGPNTADPPVLRYTKVFETGLDKQAVDLVIKVADGSSYDPANTALNGLWPQPTPDHQQMAQLNVRCGSETTFEFSFVNSGTDTLAALSNTFFSVYDFDQPKKGGHEYAIFKTPPSAWKLMPDTQVLVNGSIADSTLQFTSTEWGTLSDNPTDPNALTPLQKSRSVTVWYSSASTFQVTLGSSTISEFGRNFLFAGPGIYCQAK